MIAHRTIIYDDEYWYSWILRMSRFNGLSAEVIYREFLTGKQSYGERKKKLNLNYPAGICWSKDPLIKNDELPVFIKRHTIYGVMHMLRNAGKGDAVVYKMLWDAGDEMSLPLRYNDVQYLYFCPECYREDIKAERQPYYRTLHHIPGCTICPIHNVRLIQVKHTSDNNEFLDADSISNYAIGFKAERGAGQDVVASKYLYTLYQHQCMTSIKELSAIINCSFPREPVYDKVLSKMVEAIPSETLVQELKLRELDVLTEMRLSLPEAFDILSKMDIVIKVRCRNCGFIYYTPPGALIRGCGCEKCNERLEKTSIVSRQLRTIGAYYLAEPFRGYNGSTKVLHAACGKISNVRLMDRIWMQQECQCTNRISVRELQNLLDTTKQNYVIKSYVGSKKEKQRIRVLHRKCNREFDVLLDKFKKSPYCRCCTPRAWNTQVFQEQLNLRKEGYVVVSDYIAQNVPVTARHNVCSTETSWLPEQWLHGNGCRLCQPIYNYESVYSYIDQYANEPFALSRMTGGLRIVFDDSRLVQISYKEAVQELSRPSRSDIFPNRTKRLYEEISDKAELYLIIKESTNRDGRWSMKDYPSSISYVRMKQIVKLLHRWGYIEKVEPGYYKTEE